MYTILQGPWQPFYPKDRSAPARSKSQSDAADTSTTAIVAHQVRS
jgi:hypothetical protein